MMMKIKQSRHVRKKLEANRYQSVQNLSKIALMKKIRI